MYKRQDQPLLTHQASCAICEAGRFGDVQGLSNCKNCATGQYENREGSVGCSECATGRYGDVQGLSWCKNCAKGQYENNQGSVGCSMCPVGQYQDEEEQASCKSPGRCGIGIQCATPAWFYGSHLVGCEDVGSSYDYYCSYTSSCRFSDYDYGVVGFRLDVKLGPEYRVTNSQTAAQSIQSYTNCYNYCFDNWSESKYFQILSSVCYCYADGTSGGTGGRYTFKMNC